MTPATIKLHGRTTTRPFDQAGEVVLAFLPDDEVERSHRAWVRGA
jgi:hypothetical protein